MATRSVFLYPELLPTVMLRSFHYRSPFTPAEDCLVVLGHQHMKGTSNPLELTCQYLLAARNLKALRHHMYIVCRRQTTNVIKTYFLEHKRVLMPLACGRVSPSDQRPSVEKDQQLMPRWLLENLQLIHKEVQKYNLPLTNPEAERSAEGSVPEQDMVSEPTTSYKFTPGTRYPHSLPDVLASDAKSPPPVHRRKRKRAQRTEPPKPAPSAKDMEEALSRLPHILPKLAGSCETPPPVRVKFRRPPQVTPVLKRKRGRPLSKRGRVHSSADHLTLPSVPRNPGGVSANNDGVGHVMALDVHKAYTTNANIIMALPAAVIHPATIAKVIQMDTPLLDNENMNQRCGTLLKLGLEQKLNVNPPPVSHEHYIILPPGCVVTDGPNVTLQSLSDQQVGGAVTGDAATHSASLHQTQKTAALSTPVHRTDQSHIQESVLVREEDETMVTEVLLNEDGPKEMESELFRKPFLTLSESSGSPTPSVPDEDLQDTAVGGEDKRLGGQSDELIHPPEQMDRWTERRREAREKGSVSNLEPNGAECTVLQEENFTDGTLRLFHDDLSDADPRRDIKDVAFAHAYLEKVCEALQVVPGKVEEFLSILYEFERNPEDRTATELFLRLKPVLWEWPELLQDFAAFLHPEQAQECDLLAEQQAFERSKRFLRKLELCFGEGSVHYRKVVRTLQQGLPTSRRASEEIKAQISMLFLNNDDLLEEYWAFYAQLHPSMQPDDEDEVDHARGVSCVDMVYSSKGSPQQEFIKPSSDTPKIEAVPNQTCFQNTMVNPKAEACGEGTVTNHRRTAEESHHAAAHSPVCAQNSSHTPSGEKVVLWTREADRVILTMCQQRGACRRTFTCVATHLGNKTPAEVSERYQHLIQLFHKSTKQRDVAFNRSDEEPD